MNDARARGVSHFLNIGVEQESFPQVLAISEAHADVSCSVGTHPLYVGIHATTFDWVRAAAQHPKVVAIGETGLDYYRLQGDLGSSIVTREPVLGEFFVLFPAPVELSVFAMTLALNVVALAIVRRFREQYE